MFCNTHVFFQGGAGLQRVWSDCGGGQCAGPLDRTLSPGGPRPRLGPICARKNSLERFIGEKMIIVQSGKWEE